jgi:hypothetical protein
MGVVGCWSHEQPPSAAGGGGDDATLCASMMMIECRPAHVARKLRWEAARGQGRQAGGSAGSADSLGGIPSATAEEPVGHSPDLFAEQLIWTQRAEKALWGQAARQPGRCARSAAVGRACYRASRVRPQGG